jgi:hypothetical protein
MEHVEVWLAVDEHGNRAVSLESAAEARAAVLEDYESEAVRVVKLNVHMDLPEVPEVDIEVPKDGEEVEAEAEAAEAEEEELEAAA